jgi:hypothetical protein
MATKKVTTGTPRQHRRDDDVRLVAELYVMPKSHAAYRAKAIDGLCDLLAGFVELTMQPGEFRGFWYTAETIDGFTEAVDDLVKTLANGATRYHDGRQRAAINALVGPSAKTDKTLQRLIGLQGTTTTD